MIQPTIKSMNNVRIKFAEVISAMALYDKEKTFLLEMNLLTNVLIELEDKMQNLFGDYPDIDTDNIEATREFICDRMGNGLFILRNIGGLETVMTDDEYTILRLFHARLCAY